MEWKRQSLGNIIGAYYGNAYPNRCFSRGLMNHFAGACDDERKAASLGEKIVISNIVLL